MQPLNKKLRQSKSKRPIRLPNGHCAEWVFDLIKHWGVPRVIDFAAFKARKSSTWSFVRWP